MLETDEEILTGDATDERIGIAINVCIKDDVWVKVDK